MRRMIFAHVLVLAALILQATFAVAAPPPPKPVTFSGVEDVATDKLDSRIDLASKSLGFCVMKNNRGNLAGHLDLGKWSAAKHVKNFGAIVEVLVIGYGDQVKIWEWPNGEDPNYNECLQTAASTVEYVMVNPWSEAYALYSGGGIWLNYMNASLEGECGIHKSKLEKFGVTCKTKKK